MKRLIICMLAFLLVYTNGTAQTITVADVEALPGETVTFVLNLSGGKADIYTSLQFDAEFPSGFTTTGDYSISPKWKNASAIVGDVIDGVATVPVSSAEVITGSDVEGLFSVDFKVDESVALGDYDVTLRKITFGYGFTDKDIAADVTFTVHVVSTHTIVLDENSTTVPETAEGVNVRVLRTINAGEWSTICLPFAMSESQVKTAFGGDVQLGNFTGYDVTENDAGDIVGITVHFANASAIEANHPYIIKVSAPVSEFMVEGVDIAPEDEPTVAAVKRTRKQWSEMIGSYVPMTIAEEMLFLSENKFWYSAGNTRMKGFRAYFDFYDVLSNVENASARIAVAFNDDAPTGVTERQLPEVSEKAPFYDLQGRRIMARPAQGLYIQNGQKRIVK